MTARLRWTLVGVVLVLAAAVALWPLFTAENATSGPTGAPAGGGPAPAAPADPEALAQARAAAALRPCPTSDNAGSGSTGSDSTGSDSTGSAGTAGGGAPAGLAGVRVSCLGDGSTVDLGAVLAGRPALINVWATWCPPCREELPLLDEYAGQPGAVTVLGVQIQERSSPEDGLATLTDLGVRLPSVVDQDRAVSSALGTPNYLPVSYVVDADGAVHQVDPPTPFRSVDQIRETVARYTGTTR
ncbi:TlpA family protein disulfide reductase [Goodfellowiella coeruleoviolacea]|uniref:Thiol-disulfide isomerase or thioredoxin n=1 Tax=Goodfellowiella coeruleoviolacea TaxID=334858 RepID=A0AAE3GAC7_9PSEU|nr:TlpA disulfide reductase family protein [Goodfellowiella coeruleoviolacea]MCP2164612.1 Thiol-disulfide isomerase or thioredoxin [Goodfellowiella coeruleoviolacea]